MESITQQISIPVAGRAVVSVFSCGVFCGFLARFGYLFGWDLLWESAGPHWRDDVSDTIPRCAKRNSVLSVHPSLHRSPATWVGGRPRAPCCWRVDHPRRSPGTPREQFLLICRRARHSSDLLISQQVRPSIANTTTPIASVNTRLCTQQYITHTHTHTHTLHMLIL